MRKPALILLAMLIAAPAAFLGALKAANAILEHKYPPPGRMFSVGTHQLHLYCFGSGGPAVVIEPGLGTSWVSWNRIATRLAETRQVCVYDRAGYGWSEAGPMPRTANRIAGELHELLANARVPQPYVLVGHSFGAHVARAYASRFASSLRGVVLVEPADEKEREPGSPVPQPPRKAGSALSLPPLGWTRIKRMYAGESRVPADLKSAPLAFRNRHIIWSPASQLEAEKSELGTLLESDAEVRTAPFPPAVPLTVITASRGKDPSIHIHMQERLAHLSPQGRFIICESKSHFLHTDCPDMVLNAIRDISR